MSEMVVDDVPRTPLPLISRDVSRYPSLPQDLVDEFTERMNMPVRSALVKFLSAGSDKGEFRNMLFAVLDPLSILVSQTALKNVIIDLSSDQVMVELIRSLNDDEIEDWKSAVQNRDWERLIRHPKLQRPVIDEDIFSNNEKLSKAYTQDIIGDSAT
ncbi:hypothetical protein APHAL10511_003330 [Amanita phalloides]|nr:hypothetical protein APHAL10511_003330 [Amanita phalloides]